MSLYIRRYDRADMAIAVYVAIILISQILATKLVEFDVGFVAPAGVILFPFTFQLTDMINEKFGQRETHRAILIAFLTQVVMVFFFLITASLPGFIPSSQSIDALAVWNGVFGFTIGITIASWIAFLISENLDAYIYQVFKRLTGGRRYLWLRNMGSDGLSLIVDSIVFVPLAFFIFPLLLTPNEVLPESVIIDILVGQIILKLLFGLVDTPFMYLSRWLMYGELDDRFPFLKRFELVK